MAVVTDREECNKKAFLALNSGEKSETLPAELSLVDARSNLVHTLRDSGSLDIHRKLRKCLTLACVRNKDRMAVEPIVRLTRPTVLDVLEEVAFVVHTVAPEKYRFWKSNQGG